jgi:serine/threonine-protein kinase
MGDLGAVRPGDVLAGKYRVERVIGVGGMGVVVAARHLKLDTKVAIKFLLPAMLANREAVVRFAHEAQSSVRIENEHVARVLDVGARENGAPYMVMEYLEGGDLSAWLQQRGPLPVEQAVEFVLQACVAVADAHGLGIVHRDLKPANLFCVRRSDGQFLIKVLDFGISKAKDATGSMGVTSTSAVLGSPLYMSPEQMQSPKDVDAATDIWALGVVLYELLTGHVPFEGETFGELAVKAATRPPPPLRSYRPEAPPDLEAVILTCLQPDRRRRHRNVAELARALFPFAPRRARASVERISGIIQASGLSASALDLPPSPVDVLDPTLAVPGTVAPVGHTKSGVSHPARGRSAAVVVAVAGVLVIASVGGGVAYVRGQRPHVDPSAAAAPLAADLPTPKPTPKTAPPPPPVNVETPVVTAPSAPSPRATATASASVPAPARTTPPEPTRTAAPTQTKPPPPLPPPVPSTPAAAATPSNPLNLPMK